ncbi:Na+/H+ antiporter NhaC family protein [Halalkalibacterium ligniniphilum]|uniref:Na+/H+ antiporter NhaC family protein n=1 Tax=Halalkalibacterium ligniniphilum TaxID=1134413 RepID=UPI00034883D9
MEPSILSLLPPILSLLLVILTKKVLLSLGIGIIVGSLMLNGFNPVESIMQIFTIFAGIFVVDGAINDWELYIIFFLLLLGMMASFIAFSGGSQAFGEWAIKRVKTRRGAQLLPIFLGFLVFIDDYFNSILVGNVSRPLTDRHRVSRAKLAYFVDSTSAPVCVIAPLSSWGAYIITIIAGVLTTHGVTEYGSLQAFILMIPMNLYALIALALILAVAWFNLDIGAMKIHEKRAIQTGQLVDPDKKPLAGVQEEIQSSKKGTIGDLVWPIITLVVVTVFFMVLTGIQGTDGEVSLLSIFENTDVSGSLVYGGIAGFITALIFNLRKKVTWTEVTRTSWAGIQSMLPAIYILILAWIIIEIIGDLGTGQYLASLVDGNVSPVLLPAILFLIAAFTAFSTGTSWGDFWCAASHCRRDCSGCRHYDDAANASGWFSGVHFWRPLFTDFRYDDSLFSGGREPSY